MTAKEGQISVREWTGYRLALHPFPPVHLSLSGGSLVCTSKVVHHASLLDLDGMLDGAVDPGESSTFHMSEKMPKQQYVQEIWPSVGLHQCIFFLKVEFVHSLLIPFRGTSLDFEWRDIIPYVHTNNNRLYKNCYTWSSGEHEKKTSNQGLFLAKREAACCHQILPLTQISWLILSSDSSWAKSKKYVNQRACSS